MQKLVLIAVLAFTAAGAQAQNLNQTKTGGDYAITSNPDSSFTIKFDPKTARVMGFDTITLSNKDIDNVKQAGNSTLELCLSLTT